MSRGTKDADVLETLLDDDLQAALLELAGPNTALHVKHRLYVDIVRQGLPFLPHPPIWHEVDLLNQQLSHFTVQALDIVDVVVSKLKRFSANDRSDIDEMAERGYVDPATLVARFESAKDWYLYDARANELPRYIRNLHTVERDILGVVETEIELPSWVGH